VSENVERALDVILLAMLIGVMVRTPSLLVRAAMLVACAMVLLGWFSAWHRRRDRTAWRDGP
jgi:hypothetical protein